MSARSAVGFADTAPGAAFHHAYDRVLRLWPVDVTSIDLPSEYGTTRVNVCGPADAPPVLLLPGAGATSTVWFANAAALAEHHRVYAVDLLGDAGRSLAASTPVRTVDDLLAWLDTVIDAIGLTEFGLVGHSYGAMIALAHTLAAPARIRNLVLIDPNSCFAGMRPAYLAHAIPLLLRPTEKRQRDFIAWETGGKILDPAWLDLLATGTAHFPKSKTVIPKRPTRHQLDTLAVDTTVILAADSKVHHSRALAETITATLPRLHTVVVDGATHHTLPMHPAGAVNDALIRALASR